MGFVLRVSFECFRISPRSRPVDLIQSAWNATIEVLSIGQPTPALGADIDYAMLVKLYGKEKAGPGRYSPPHVTGTKQRKVTGKPDKQHVSTSFVERQNLTMRMSMRRFTRLTNGFSKKIENLEHAVALHFMYYNFVRIHKSLHVTPAMAAGVTDKLWNIEDIVGLLEDKEVL